MVNPRTEMSEILEITDTLKGEMVVVCSGYVEDANKYLSLDPIVQVDELIVAGIVKNEAIKMVAKRLGIPKQELYKAYSDKKSNQLFTQQFYCCIIRLEI